MSIKKIVAAAAVCLGSQLAVIPLAFAQEAFPNKPVNLYIPFGAGAATDAFARIIGEGISRISGQPVIATNRPGANGLTAVRAAATAPADGHTLLILANGIVIEQVLKKLTDFDVRRDLIPVARASQAPLGLFASNSLPANSVREFIDYAKKNPGKVNYATSGVGSIAHLTTERLRLATGLELVHIPYPAGTAPINIALMAGDVQLFVNEMGSMRTLVMDKKVKVLATLGDQRLPIYPDTPSVPELGVPELRNVFAPFFFGFFVVPGTESSRVEALATLINKAIDEPTVKERLVKLGYNPALLGGTRPAEFRKVVNDELDRVTAVIRDAKIQAQ
jgi:tripartite-type tricarboxylate transporter receptor subunit TctC